MAQSLTKFDYGNIDPKTIDPDKLNLGTDIQDCALIANTYERGAHTIPTEAAVFATFSRSIQNRKRFATAASDSVSSYTQTATNTGSSIFSQAADVTQVNQATVGAASAISDTSLQSLGLGDQQNATYGKNFGNQLLDKARQCIPCDLRLVAFLELHPDLNLMKGLEDFIKSSIKLFNGLLDMLNNLDEYSDFCNFLNTLSFMCVPDLQRIIALLMALFMSNAIALDGMIGMLQALIAPLFAPVLMAITSLLDQFSSLVVGPMQCIMDTIRNQLKSRGLEYGYYSNPGSGNDAATQIGGGLAMLNKQLDNGVNTVKTKLDFYIRQANSMMGEMGSGDAAYLQSKTQALTLVRMIAFVIAIISALSKGHAACSPSKTPEQSELDNFFQNFLGPQTPFNIYVGPDGQIRAEEKLSISAAPLSDKGNVVQFEGEPLLDPAVVQQIQTKLVEPIKISPCKLEVKSSDVDKIDTWIKQLNQS